MQEVVVAGDGRGLKKLARRRKTLIQISSGYNRKSAKFMSGFSYDIKHDPVQSQLLGVDEDLQTISLDKHLESGRPLQ